MVSVRRRIWPNSIAVCRRAVWSGDSATSLADSVLVTNVAGGHGFYGLGASTDSVVDKFLISCSKPAAGSTCHDRNRLVTMPGVAVTG
jgi:hypothetical protein